MKNISYYCNAGIAHGGVKLETVHKPTRNPFRIAAATWRLIRDLTRTEDAAIVEMTFMKSRFLGKYARWDDAARELRADPRTCEAFERRPRIGSMDVEKLSALPVGTLGHAFGTHMKSNGLNPYIFEPIVDNSDEDYVMGHLLETHDIWHIVTGFDTDIPGEFAGVAFYAAQTGLATSSMLLTIGFANTTLFAPTELRARLGAVAKGWALGQQAEPLFGVDWNELWEVPLSELRARFGLSQAVQTENEARAAA
jgi:ubiquinone biosynthesis protein Coq4